MERYSNVIVILILVIVGVVVFGNAIGNGFIWDNRFEIIISIRKRFTF